ncbi:MAG TPA: hypothetical protein PLP27_03640 [Crocinitomicaceae bacterium]|nr:hypothetical protein [Crocinitomicaceae bacterium]
MNSTAIANIISNAQPIDTVNVSELKLLADNYPYSQIFAVLYLKSLAVSKSFSFDEELPKYAYRITDKAKLYEIIHAKESISISEPIEIELIEEEIPEIEIENTPEISEPIEVIVDEIDVPETEEIDIPIVEISAQEEVDIPTVEISEQEELIEREIEEINVPTVELIEDETEVEIHREEPIEDNAPSELEIDILESAIDKALPAFLENEIAEEVSELERDEIAEQTPEVEPEITEQKTVIEKDTLQTFSGWLSFGQAQKLEKKNTFEDEKEVFETKKDNLINQFIEKNPSISRPKKEFFSAPKKAQESVNDSGLLYSETLANIYVIQGNFPLAIKAYEQLCLTIPEKRTIFAKKIEELKEKINNLK